MIRSIGHNLKQAWDDVVLGFKTELPKTGHQLLMGGGLVISFATPLVLIGHMSYGANLSSLFALTTENMLTLGALMTPTVFSIFATNSFRRHGMKERAAQELENTFE